jgi:hypothetical protein
MAQACHFRYGCAVVACQDCSLSHTALHTAIPCVAEHPLHLLACCAAAAAYVLSAHSDSHKVYISVTAVLCTVEAHTV